MTTTRTGKYLSSHLGQVGKAEFRANMKLAKPLVKGLFITDIMVNGLSVGCDLYNRRYKSAGARVGVALGIGMATSVDPWLGIGLAVSEPFWGEDFYNYVENNW